MTPSISQQLAPSTMPGLKRKTSMQLFPSVNPSFDAFVAEQAAKESEWEAEVPKLGYPLNNHMLEPLLALHNITARRFNVNNCGDPLSDARKQYHNTLPTEGKLLTAFMAQWGATPENCWGYVTTGGTEGVTEGVKVGYERLLARGFQTVVTIHSAASHYSVPKAVISAVGHEEDARAKSMVLDVNDDNSMNMAKLDEALAASRVLGIQGVLLILNMGTTFFGGVDDVAEAQRLLSKHGYQGSPSYVHVDGALHGGWWNDAPDTPKWRIGDDFDSISVSAHKWWGGTTAGMVLMTKQHDTDFAGKAVEVVDLVDRFISGSRAGLSVVLWQARVLQLDWPAEYQRCVANRKYLAEALRDAGVVCADQHINVIFQRPSEELHAKWALMTVGDEAQALLMPHADRASLEEFVADMKAERIAGKLREPTARLERLNGVAELDGGAPTCTKKPRHQ